MVLDIQGGKKKVIFFFARFFQRWLLWLFLQHLEAPHGTCICPKPSVQRAGSWDERAARAARNERRADVPAGFLGHRPAGGFPALSTRGQAHHLSTKMMTDECWQRTRALVLQPVIFKQIVHHPPLKKKQKTTQQNCQSHRRDFFSRMFQIAGGCRCRSKFAVGIRAREACPSFGGRCAEFGVESGANGFEEEV